MHNRSIGGKVSAALARGLVLASSGAGCALSVAPGDGGGAAARDGAVVLRPPAVDAAVPDVQPDGAACGPGALTSTTTSSGVPLRWDLTRGCVAVTWAPTAAGLVAVLSDALEQYLPPCAALCFRLQG